MTKHMTWIKPGGIENRNRSMIQLKEQYQRCSAAILCKTLYRGFLYACNRTMALHDLGYIKSEEDRIRVEECSKEVIKDFYDKEWCLGCNYCDLYSNNSERCIAGEQTKAVLK